jgi:hypothetical protein
MRTGGDVGACATAVEAAKTKQNPKAQFENKPLIATASANLADKSSRHSTGAQIDLNARRRLTRHSRWGTSPPINRDAQAGPRALKSGGLRWTCFKKLR